MKPVGTLVGSGQYRQSHRDRGPGAVAGARAQGQDGKRGLEWKLVADQGKVYICLYRK